MRFLFIFRFIWILFIFNQYDAYHVIHIQGQRYDHVQQYFHKEAFPLFGAIPSVPQPTPSSTEDIIQNIFNFFHPPIVRRSSFDDDTSSPQKKKIQMNRKKQGPYKGSNQNRNDNDDKSSINASEKDQHIGTEDYIDAEVVMINEEPLLKEIEVRTTDINSLEDSSATKATSTTIDDVDDDYEVSKLLAETGSASASSKTSRGPFRWVFSSIWYVTQGAGKVVSAPFSIISNLGANATAEEKQPERRTQYSPRSDSRPDRKQLVNNENHSIGKRILGGTMRIIRRRLLNIWDDGHQWRSAVTNDQDMREDGSGNGKNKAVLYQEGVYVSSRKFRRPRNYEDVIATVRTGNSTTANNAPKRYRKRTILKEGVKKVASKILSPISGAWNRFVSSQDEFFYSDAYVPPGTSSLLDSSNSQYNVFKRRQRSRISNSEDETFDRQFLLDADLRKRRQFISTEKRDVRKENEKAFRFGINTISEWIMSTVNDSKLLVSYTQNQFSTGAPLADAEPPDIVTAQDGNIIEDDISRSISVDDSSDNRFDLAKIWQAINQARISFFDGTKQASPDEINDMEDSQSSMRHAQHPFNDEAVLSDETKDPFFSPIRIDSKDKDGSSDIQDEAGSKVMNPFDAFLSAQFWPWNDGSKEASTNVPRKEDREYSTSEENNLQVADWLEDGKIRDTRTPVDTFMSSVETNQQVEESSGSSITRKWWNYFPLSLSILKGFSAVVNLREKIAPKEMIVKNAEKDGVDEAMQGIDPQADVETLREVTGTYVDIYNKDIVQADLERNDEASMSSSSNDPWLQASLELNLIRNVGSAVARAIPATQIIKSFMKFRNRSQRRKDIEISTEIENGNVDSSKEKDLPYQAQLVSPAMGAMARAAVASYPSEDFVPDGQNESSLMLEDIEPAKNRGITDSNYLYSFFSRNTNAADDMSRNDSDTTVVEGVNGIQTYIFSEGSSVEQENSADDMVKEESISNEKEDILVSTARRQVRVQPRPSKTPVPMGRTNELKDLPDFLDVPLPSKADFGYIAAQRMEVALAAAANIRSEEDASQFLQYIGTDSLKKALLGLVPKPLEIDRVDAVKSICRLVRYKKSVAAEIASNENIISVLCDMMESPFRGFKSLQSTTERTKKLRAQAEATALIQRFVRSSDTAVEHLRYNERLRNVLKTIVEYGDVRNSLIGVAPLPYQREFVKKYVVSKADSNATAEYVDLKPSQMARVALWGLGGLQWKPRQPGQKGLRILTFDGGGTKGVLSIAFLKEIMMRVNRDLEPHQIFDMICGTSTGGIIAALLAGQRRPLEDAEKLYDDLIGEIFGQKSNLQLVTKQAAYDEKKWEQILSELCGDQMLLDSNQHDCPRLFCISTKVNLNPPQPMVWRNYNYPPGQESRYGGAFRIPLKTAVRATTAAPTFFTPVPFESGLFCDGALVANNPTAIAIQEAKVLYPGVPIEMVVSIGTGYINELSTIKNMGWDLLVNQLIASSTDTEDVHALLVDFLPKNQYFRFNPLLSENLPIDEKNKDVLQRLKQIAKDHVQEMEEGPDGKYLKQLINTLRCGR